MNRAVLVLLLALLGAGCSSHSTMMETMDRGLVFEKEGRDLERAGEFSPAAERYAQCAADLEEALRIAEERQNAVFVSMLNAKLSIIASGQGRCAQPDNNPQGSWEQALAHHARAAQLAGGMMFLKMKGNALVDQAQCQQPDRNPQGSWAEAVELYAQAAAAYKASDADEELAVALRKQALALMEGDTAKAASPEARALLERARKLGDEDAAQMLSSSGARYCAACGGGLEEDARFCPRCGRDQLEATRPEQPKPRSRPKGPLSKPPSQR